MEFYGGADTLPGLLEVARGWVEDDQRDLDFELVPESSRETGPPT